ncbi:MAG: alpha/beta hydrolase family protein, partial [Planctomycetota bacterium]
KSVYGKVGIIAHQDQAAAVRALAAERPYFDLERIGVWGWSGGGSMTLNALFHYPDLYRAGIAIAFVADQRLYDTIYQERYMGLLADNEVGYREGSPITHAHRLEGDVLLVYGSVDDNTHYQNFERLVDALIAHDKPFDALPYPGRTHGIFERANTRRHLYGSMTRWLEEHLPAGAR